MLHSLRRGLSLFTAQCVLVSTPAFGDFQRAPAAPDFNLTALRRLDPLLAEFADAPAKPELSNLWAARELDDNPFLMRGQSFGPALADASERSAFAPTRGGLRVQVRGTDRALEIGFGLAPLFELDDYLFFRPTAADAFAARLGDAPPSQGVFFLRKQYVHDELRRSGERRPVPIFFLPLAGAWTGAVSHVVDLSTGTLALNDGAGASATIALDTLDEFARVLHLNATLATLMALKGDPDATAAVAAQLARLAVGQTPELPFALPPRGSTFAFGTIFTGVDLDHPDRGLARARSDFGSWLNPLPRAHAALAPDVYASLMTTLAILGTTWVVSTLAQVTVMKSKLAERRRLIETKRPPPDLGTRRYELRAAVKDNLDMLANATTMLGNGIQTAGGYLVEYAADRSGVRAAQNGWIRKIIANTMIYTRRQAELINVNGFVMFLGVAVAGGIGLGALYLQLVYLSPVVFPSLAGLFSEKLRGRVAADFSGGHEVTNGLVGAEFAANVQGTVVQGAWSAAAGARNALIEVAKPKVYRQVARDAQDRHDQDAIDDEIDRQIAPMIVARGLPADDEFLFSAPTAIRGIARLMGYHVPRAEIQRSRDADPERDPSFLLEKARFGLTSHAIKDALREMTAHADRHPDDPNPREAVVILTEIQRRFHTLFALARDPRHAGRVRREGHRVRKLLTLLSLEDSTVGLGLKFMDQWRPEDPAPLERLKMLSDRAVAAVEAEGLRVTPRRVRRRLVTLVAAEDPAVALALEDVGWRRTSIDRRLAEVRAEAARGLLGAAVRNPRAAILAGRGFRNALFGLVKGPTEATVGAKDLAEFRDEARAEALARLRGAPPPVIFGAADVEIETLEIVKQKVAARTKRARELAWRPAAPDWLERRQVAAAHAAAERAVGFDVAGGDPARERAYRESFGRAFARQVGLRPIEDPSRGAEYEVNRHAVAEAETEFQYQLANNETWRTYLGEISADERLRFLAHQYADVYLSKYTEFTAGNSAFVPLTSPAQPGFFQAARQTEFARRDNWLGRTTTFALRVGDAMFDATAARPGVKSWIYRRVPFAQDLTGDTIMRLRAFPTFALISWNVNYYLWGVHFNLPTMIFFWFTAGLTAAAHNWTDRIMVNVGKPPLEGVRAQAKYAVLLEALTYFTMVPFLFFAQDFERMFYGTWHRCQSLLGGRTRP